MPPSGLPTAASPLPALRAGWVHQAWLALLVVAITGFSFVYACAPPFAAFSAIAAMTLSRREAIGITIALWLANQVIGFGVQGYPWTANSVSWGVVMGVAAVLTTMAARRIAARLVTLGPLVQAASTLLGAFAIYEVLLIAPAVGWLGDTQSFAPAIVGQILIVNVAALAGLVVLHRVGVIAGLSGGAERRVPASRAASL